jgi:hypothetical protein
MINETGGLGSTIQNERLFRENNVTETEPRKTDQQPESSQQKQTNDTVSLSAEAIAQSRNVPPTGAANEVPVSLSESSESPAEESGEQRRPGTIDIQA